jgi:hypothetical protein
MFYHHPWQADTPQRRKLLELVEDTKPKSSIFERGAEQATEVKLPSYRSNRSMRQTAPFRNKFSLFATAPCRGLALSR